MICMDTWDNMRMDLGEYKNITRINMYPSIMTNTMYKRAFKWTIVLARLRP